MSTVTMQAPSSFGGSVMDTPSGTVYVPDSNGYVAAQYEDIAILLSLGFVTIVTASSINYPSILNFKNADGSSLAAAASSGKFGIGYTAGSALYLLSEAANGNTKTDTVLMDLEIPQSHVTGNNVTIDINSNVVIGSGTLSARSLVVTVYREVGDGTLGSNLVASGGTITVGNTAATSSVVVTGTGLVGGTRLLAQGILTLTETASSNVTAHINQVAVRG